MVTIGEIVLQKNLLSAKQLFVILNQQREEGGQFGYIAVKNDFLTKAQVKRLLDLQKTLRKPVGSILVEFNKVDQKTLDEVWGQYQNYVNGDEAATTTESIQEAKKERNIIFKDIQSTCPVCKEAQMQQLVDPDCHNVIKHDIDLRPTEYSWNENISQTEDPILFDIWECSNCHFTAKHRYFFHPTCELSMSDYNFARRMTKNLESNENIKRFYDCEIPPGMDYIVPILKTYQAIYILEQIPHIVRKDALPVASHYHHLAWLFRGIETKEQLKKIRKLAGKFRDIWPDIPVIEEEALGKALKSYETAYYESEQVERDHFSHVILQIMGRINIYLKKPEEAEELFKETSKILESRILEITNQLETKDLSEEQSKKLNEEKDKLVKFLMETVSLFSHLEKFKS